ncbi:sigma-54-dependent Fis family transcriptional regulator [Zoogloea sp.]|uniref:sigma-54-dependent Fis family transcriptional regulator n=1 Tax=Zoogloea sp. TaxID=49181 RepID=UPI002C1495D6|nr:sigma-54-dependent Fis family transcriptional regulator [Zoogloea sp.]HPI61302.1 sigma-54-dependent Fis family transcriptional regulator [Zoogloea sp.]
MIRGQGEIARHVERVVEVVERGVVLSRHPVHDRLARSWQRSLSKYQVDPGLASTPQVVTAQELREHRDKLDAFMRIAREGLDRLHEQLRPSNYCVLMTDAAGVTVDFRTVPEQDKEFRAQGFRNGTRWSEMDEGTCGVGTSLVDGQPILVHRGEHFRSHNIGFTCSSAPIFGIDDRPLAVLDASALYSPEHRDSQMLVFQMVIEKARLIEDAFAFYSLRDHWILQLGRTPELMNVHTDYLLAFDDAGMFVGGNRRARRELLARPGRHIQSVSDLFECSASDLLAAAHARPGQAIPLRVMDSGERIFGLLRAPDVRRHSVPALERDTNDLNGCSEARGFGHLATGDSRVRTNVQRALKVANRDIPVMLLGETGTGKEAFAKAVHDCSSRHKQPFVALNCAAIPESLIESELFGYRDGAFTGARAKGARGKIVQSDQGTLFLDEIGDMPLVLQSRLLRVLAEGEVQPLGAEQPIPVKLHIICATHQNLPALVEDGRFREDLYYRLNGAVFILPPLREREDIGEVIDRVLAEEIRAMGREGLRLAPETRDALMRHGWPGNIRQLRHAMRYACAICDSNLLHTAHFPPDLFFGPRLAGPRPQREDVLVAPAPVALQPDSDLPPLKEKDLRLRERMLETLRRNQWQVTVSAQELGMSRATFYRKLARLNIVPPNRRDF